MVRTAVLIRARAKHANEGQRPFALRRSDASLRCGLRRRSGTDQRAHCDDGGKQQRSFRQNVDHDQPLPICTQNCRFRFAEAWPRNRQGCSVPRSKVTSQSSFKRTVVKIRIESARKALPEKPVR
jgi:hypothetical protein